MTPDLLRLPNKRKENKKKAETTNGIKDTMFRRIFPLPFILKVGHLGERYGPARVKNLTLILTVYQVLRTGHTASTLGQNQYIM